MRNVFFYVFLVFGGIIYGQYSSEYQTYKALYPESSFVRLKQETTFKIKLVDNSIAITRETTEEDLYLSDGASYGSKNSLNYSTFYDLKEINAASLTYTGKKYKAVEVSEFSRKNDLDDSFYDDSKTVSYVYPDLKKGGKTRLNYTYQIKNPRFLNAFYFGDYFPIVYNKVTIIADKGVKLAFKEFQTEGENISYTKKNKGRTVVHTWVLENQEEFEPESNAPNYKTILPHIIPRVVSYKANKKEVPLSQGVGDLYDWYYSLVKNINKDPNDEELERIVNTLVKDKKTEKEKVEAIYYWTQKNIKYIAFEYALGGFIPREANDVFKKKYGDCKDNSSILLKMLEIAGIKGNLTWIGTRKIPYTYEDVPTPAVDNHMILAYKGSDKTYFLDATGRYISMEYPTAFIQGKEALIAQGEDDYLIEQVPVVPAHMNSMIDTTFVRLNGKTLEGNSSVSMKGYIKNDMFYSLENLTKETKLKSYYNRRFSKGNNKFLIQSFKENHKYSYTQDYTVDYDFIVNDYFKELNNEIYFNPHLNKVLSNFSIKKDRKYSLEYKYKKAYSFVTQIKIPDGYLVDYLPEKLVIENELIDIKLDYQKKEGIIECLEQVSFKYLLLNKEDQKTIQKSIKKIRKAYKEIIIFKKK